MLKSQSFRLLVACGLAAAVAAPLLAAPADAVRTRIAGLKELGAAFKAVNDGVRADPVPTAAIQQAVVKIRNASRNQYKWFPVGSGAAGLKTRAKPEIWTKAPQFRAAQDAFARQAAVLEVAAKSGNAATIQAEARKLGGTCKACHDAFRMPSD